MTLTLGDAAFRQTEHMYGNKCLLGEAHIATSQLVSDDLFRGTTAKPNRPGMGTFYAYVYAYVSLCISMF